MNIFCDECKKNIATVFLTKVSATEVSKVQLCEECAKRMEETTEAANLIAFLPHILAGLQGMDEEVSEEVLPGELSVCDSCGTSYNDFSKMGYLGCADCYGAFAEPLGRIIMEFQDGDEHRGKVPGKASKGALLRRRLVELERNLARQISTEQYEAAAAVRDQIREIEGRLEGATGDAR